MNDIDTCAVDDLIIDEVLQNNSNWKIKERFVNNNGLTILIREV